MLADVLQTRCFKNFANFRGKHLCWISEQLQWLLLNKRNYKYTANKYTTALSWNSALFLSIRSQMFCEIGVLKACNFIHATKELPRHVFCCELCEIFKNACFYRTRPVTVSDRYCGGNTKYGLLLKFLFLRKQQYRKSQSNDKLLRKTMSSSYSVIKNIDRSKLYL